jgi:hypothetical protein
MPYPAGTACYANPNPIFQPAARLIESITNANPAVVTTTFAHQYKDGTIVRLDIPPADGMQQANQLTGTITVLSPITFAIDIDTTNFAPFAIPAAPARITYVCAFVVPVGVTQTSINQAVRIATVNILNPFM